MTIDPKAKALLIAIAAAGEPAVTEIPVDVARAQVEQGYASMRTPVMPVASMQDVVIRGPGGELTLRIYTPFGEGPFPVVVFFHGGGWVLFRLDAYDPICTNLCAESGFAVVSVDYRLAPEAKFPAATDDCLAATRWVAAEALSRGWNPERIFVAGDSAGGNLATVTALRIRNEGGPRLAGQVVIYPVTNYYIPNTASFREFSEGYGLTAEAMGWFWGHYLRSSRDAANPYAAPMLAKDLSGLPAALLIIAGFDPLRDEGMAYARRLEAAGVPVQLSCYEEMIHGFISYLGILQQGKTAIREIAAWLKKQNSENR